MNLYYNLAVEGHERIMEHTDLVFQRYLHKHINWNNRLIAIVGARGVGKTTLMLQHIKQHPEGKSMMYLSAEHIYFSMHSLTEFADTFTKQGGKVLFIDEIHQYKNWAREVKVIYDTWPKLKLVISGSSILDLYAGSTDLSRRMIAYHLAGLSLREYMELAHHIKIPVQSITDIKQHKKVKFETPIKYFGEYLNHGYYPFFSEGDYQTRLMNVINKIIDTDLVKHIGLNVNTGTKLKRLLGHISGSAPFTPNLTKLAELTGISFRLLPEYMGYMERGGLIHNLHHHGKHITVLAKPDKLFLNNPNLMYALHPQPEIGSLRETFFVSQMRTQHQITLPKQGDFLIDGTTYEIGGKSKTRKQLREVFNGFVVQDDIEVGHNNILPLWKFGLLY